MNRLFRLSYSLMPGGMSVALNRILMAPRADENIDPTEGQS